MKFSALVALACASLAAAQTINDVPKCALPCLQDAIEQQTSCSVDDLACVCKGENVEKFQDAATDCVVDACGLSAAWNDVLPAVKKVCENQ
ncbi:hypothetical protein BJX61DRAFT_541571 [Aspergillus egyptiacus]|nr:hypothetical protein BJX61DRAFT_541571 [Aspergillus egyptiacus]